MLIRNFSYKVIAVNILYLTINTNFGEDNIEKAEDTSDNPMRSKAKFR